MKDAPLSFFLFLVLLFVLVSCSLATTTSRPNIVVFLADDLGYGDVGFSFAQLKAASRQNTSDPNEPLSLRTDRGWATPNIDSLIAQQGQVLQNAYAASPICTPSRTGLLTGRLPVRSGMTSSHPSYRVFLSPAQPGGLPQNETTIAEILRDQGGYATALIGKWHLGHGAPSSTDELKGWVSSSGQNETGGTYLPTRVGGFDTFYGMPMTNVQSCGFERNLISRETDWKPLFIIRRLVPPSARPYLIPLLNHWNPSNFVTLLVPPYLLLLFIPLLTLYLLIPSFRLRYKSFFFQIFLPSLLFFIVAIAFLQIAVWFVFQFTLLSANGCLLYRNESLVEQPLQLETLTARFTIEAESFIRKQHDQQKPFFLLFAFDKVHTALAVLRNHSGIAGDHQHLSKPHNVSFGDCVHELDWSIGRIMEVLKQLKLDQDGKTMIWFTSDNGPFLEEFEEGGSSGSQLDMATNSTVHPLRGGKGQTWEGGVRVPTAVRWSGVIPSLPLSRPNPFVFSHLDILPSILAATNLSAPSDVHIDGYNILPLLIDPSDDGKKTEKQRDFLYYYCGTSVTAIRDERWKVHWETPIWDEGLQHCPSRVICGCSASEVNKHDPPLLFDLLKDPSESSPISPSDPSFSSTVKRFEEARAAHQQTIVPVKNQLEILPRPWYMPCCNPPHCDCQEPMRPELYDLYPEYKTPQ